MSAIVRVIETVSGSFGYHDRGGEPVNMYDPGDIPQWKFWLAYAVQAVVTGTIEWGPYKTRAGAKKEHRGQTKVKLTATEFYDDSNSRNGNSRQESLMRMKEIIQLLRRNGFLLERPQFWGRRYENPQDEMKNPLIRRRVEIIADPPPARFWKRIEEQVYLETVMPEWQNKTGK